MMKHVFFLLTMLLLVSCAVTRKEMTEKIVGYDIPHKPQKGEGVIYVVRPSHVGTLVRFNVFLNGKKEDSEMGWNRGGQYIYFFVKPGEHTLYSVAENTAERKVTVNEGQVTYVKQETYVGVLMPWNQLYVMDEIEGKYRLMNAREGKIIQNRVDILHEARMPASK